MGRYIILKSGFVFCIMFSTFLHSTIVATTFSDGTCAAFIIQNAFFKKVCSNHKCKWYSFLRYCKGGNMCKNVKLLYFFLFTIFLCIFPFLLFSCKTLPLPPIYSPVHFCLKGKDFTLKGEEKISNKKNPS